MNLILSTLLFTSASSRLVGVVELCRHGARTPYTFISQWDNNTVWPQGPGELLPEGMRQHYLIGTELRRRYMVQTQLLLPTYYQPEIFVYSTDYDRTLMSAQSQIQGLYPAGTGPLLRSQNMETQASPPIDISDLAQLNSTMGLSALPNMTQVIPIHSDIEDRQWALDSYGTCNYYNQLIGFKSRPSKEQDDIWAQYPDVLSDVMTQMGYSEAKAKSEFSDIMDSLISNRFVNNPFPLGFNQTFYDRGIALKNRLMNFHQFEPDLLARFSGTALLNLIVQNLQNIISGQITQKFFLYSAHDTSLMCALSFLLLNHTDNPIFGSTMLFELHEYNQQFYVNVRYNDVYQNISSCGGLNCSIYNFVKFVEFRSIPNYFQACNTKMSSISSLNLTSADKDHFLWPGHNNDVHLQWYFWVSLSFYIFFGVLLFLIFKYISRQKQAFTKSNEESLMTIK